MDTLNVKQPFRTPLAFIKSVLLSYGAILFCRSYLTGFIFLLATFVNLKIGFLGLMGGTFAVFFAYRMKIHHDLIDAGIFGANGILTGLAWGYYFNLNIAMVIFLFLITFFLNKFILYLVARLGKKYGLPTLTVGFVLFAWLGIIIFKLSDFSSNGASALAFVENIENYLEGLFPFSIKVMFKTISTTFFQKSVLIGMLAFLGILIYSRISFIFALMAAVFAYFILYSLNFSQDLISDIGFNGIFIAVAFGGFFIHLSFNSLVLTFIAVSATLLMSWAVYIDLSYASLPILVFPFNFISLLFLLFLKTKENFSARYGFEFVPLDKVARPEDNLKLADSRGILNIDFSLPFYGTWKVSQGNNGRYTHKGAGRYALDFIVADERNLSYKLKGLRVEDYYCFSLPVIAPADGKVIKAVNDINDNPVGRPNMDFPWGNYVIIEHKNGVYSEISHFKKGSILVKENDLVFKGQILGKCGNSGRSYQPHIHFQIQDKASLSFETLPLKFARFITVNAGEEKIEINKAPKEEDKIKN